MSLESAELAKVALNSYVTMKITFANVLQEICQRMPNGDVDAVTDAIGLDRRIGRRYLSGGLGFGGPCFPRDNRAFHFIASQLGVQAELAKSTDQLNGTLLNLMAGRVISMLKPGSTVAVLGLSYKPHSQVIEASQAVALAKALCAEGFRVVAYDPLAIAAAQTEFRNSIVLLPSARACLAEADGVVVATPDPEFHRLTAADFGACSRGAAVFDLWRVLGQGVRRCGRIRYVPMGVAPAFAEGDRVLKKLWSGR